MATSQLHCPRFAIILIAIQSVYLPVVEGCTKDCEANAVNDAKASALLQVPRSTEGSLTRISLENEEAPFRINNTNSPSNGSDILPSPNKSSEDLLCDLKNMLNMTQVISVDDEKPLPLRRYGSCAVVSNSGALSGKEYGVEIDAAEAVFRFNEAPTKGFEKIVGEKETIRLVNCLVVRTALQNASVIVAEGAEHISHDLVQGMFGSDVKFPAKFPHTPLYRVGGEVEDKFSKWLSETWDSRWRDTDFEGSINTLTAGAVGMLIALSLCDEVKAYGMASSKQMSNAPYHYYGTSDSPNAGENKWHNLFKIEKDLWRMVSRTDAYEVSDLVAIIPGFSQMACSDKYKFS